MPSAPLHRLVGQLQTLADRPEAAPDRRLLEEFIARRDEDSFALLVRRHGPMVLGVCRSLLRQPQDAEDVFQATFLVLARKAASIRKPDSLASWLHGVAHGLARNLQARARRRGFHERRALVMPAPDPLLDLTFRELNAALSEELGRLPETYRAVLVHCCLEGKNFEEAARALGCSTGAVRGRLNRGRDALRRRLARRGIAVPAGLLGGPLPGAAPAVAPALVDATVRAALRYAVAGKLTGGLVSVQAANLAEGLVRGTLLTRLFLGAVLVLGLGFLAVSLARTPAKDEPPENAAAAPGPEPTPRTDPEGEPLPPGALARLGTTRLRHGGPINHLAFTPDGKTLVSCGTGDGIRIWDVAVGREARPFPGTPAQNIALSPDGKWLAALARTGNPEDPPFALREFATGRLVRRFGKSDNASSLLFAPDGKVLATFGWSPTVQLWDPDTGRLLRTLAGHQDKVWSVVFTPDARTLISCSDDKTIRFWDVATGRQLRQIAHTDPVGKLALSSDGQLLASVDLKKTEYPGGATTWIPLNRVHLWDAPTGRLLRPLAMPAKEVSPRVRAGFFSLAMAPDGKTLVTGDIVDGVLRVWDCASGRELRQLTDFTGTVGPIAFAPDGKDLAVGHGNGVVRLLDLATGQDRVRTPGHHNSIGSVAVTGREVVTAGGDGTLRFWDPATGRELRQRAVAPGVSGFPQILPGGKAYLAAGDDKLLHIHDLTTGRELAVLPLEDPAYSFALSPDRKTLAAFGADETLRLIEVATGKPRPLSGKRQAEPAPGKAFALMKRTEEIPGLAFVAEGQQLVVWGTRRQVTVWDVVTGKKLRQVAEPIPPGPVAIGGEDIPHTAAVSADGTLVAFGFQALNAQQRSLPVLDLATRREVCRFPTGEDGACQLAFSPDGRTLAWAGWRDGSVYLGELATGGVRQQFTGHRGRIYCLAFAADGRLLVSGGEDTTAIVWDLTGRLAVGKRSREPLAAAELKECWTALAGSDAATGWRTVQKLLADPARSVPCLGERLRPVASVGERRLAQLVADLDNGRFEVRERAMAELEKLEEVPLDAVRKALDAQPTLETRRRLLHLIERQERERMSPSPDRLRRMRALEVLEGADTPESRHVLQTLAGGAPGAWLTRQAKAALVRRSGP
jgi:RNA polymerase sigma factor (sigma-70 family)